MLIKLKLGFLMAFLGSGLVCGCATISKSECLSGNWVDLGYRDGTQGVARARIADYVHKCAEYNVSVNRQVYLENYEKGLSRYCTYNQGYGLGRNGSSYNAVCTDSQAADFRAGYNDGHHEYEIERRYENYQNRIEDKEEAITYVKDQLADPDLSSEERSRLKKKKKRLMSELDNLLWDFRDFKYRHDLL